METTKRGRGRPAGRDYGVTLTIRLSAEDAALLQTLADESGGSLGAAVRGLVRAERRRRGSGEGDGARAAVDGARPG